MSVYLFKYFQEFHKIKTQRTFVITNFINSIYYNIEITFLNLIYVLLHLINTIYKINVIIVLVCNP